MNSAAWELAQRRAVEIVKLRRALRRYGQHLPNCPLWITKGDRGDGQQHECECGLSDFIGTEEPR